MFVSGWLPPGGGSKPWGTPMGLLLLPDGSLLVADDLAGVVYVVTYNSGGE